MFQVLAFAEAIRTIYYFRFEITNENLIELTCDQYQSLQSQGEDISQRWFRITRGIFEERNNPKDELPIVSESEVKLINDAMKYLYDMSDKSGREFRTFRDRLDYCEHLLPPSLIAGR